MIKDFERLTNAEELDVQAMLKLGKEAQHLYDNFDDLEGAGFETTNALMTMSTEAKNLTDGFELLGTSIDNIPSIPDDFEIAFTSVRDMINAAYEANEQFNDSLSTGVDSSYEFGTGLKELAKNARNFSKNMEDVVIRGIQSFEDALVSAVTGTMKLKDAFKQMAASIISDIIRMTIRMQISAPIAEFLSSSLPFGSSSVPAKAMGGSVSAGKPYMVGERGAELFIPGGSGTIIPSNQVSGGGGTVVNQTINLSTGVSQTVRAEVMNMLPQIADAAKGAVIDAKRRGGRFGTAFGV